MWAFIIVYYTCVIWLDMDILFTFKPELLHLPFSLMGVDLWDRYSNESERAIEDIYGDLK